jgi:hypothetical protein
MFILWNENYKISLVATATPEIYISIPLDENKTCSYRNNLNILYIFIKRVFIFLYNHVVLQKTWLKGFRSIIIEGISRLRKSKRFDFRARMLKYEHFDVSFFQLCNVFEKGFVKKK